MRAVLIRGWLTGMALVVLGYAAVMFAGGASAVAIQLFTVLVLAIAVVSLALYPLAALPTAAILRRASLSRPAGALVFVAVGVALGPLLRTLDSATPMIAANWLCAPAFGVGGAIAWLRTRDE